MLSLCRFHVYLILWSFVSPVLGTCFGNDVERLHSERIKACASTSCWCLLRRSGLRLYEGYILWKVRSICGSLRLSRDIIVPLQLMGISRKELHVSVLALHVPEGPLLGRRHPDGLRWWLGRAEGSAGGFAGSGGGADGGCAGSGGGAGTASSAGTVFGGLALFLLPGGRPLRFGTGAGVGGSAGVGTVAGAGSGSGSAGSGGSAAAGSGSEATGGSALSAISFKDYFIGRSPRKSQRKRWSRGYLRRCRLHLSI